MKGWQPIETAKKDGTLVLLYEHGRIAEPADGHWYETRQAWSIDGWDAHPTHWMPLPEPPGSAK